MIVGHLGFAAMVRGGMPRASLLWLLPAAVAPDALDVCMALAGICNPSGLYSHTILAVALLATVTGGAAYLLLARQGTRAAALPTAIGCAVVIVLHPLLDLVTGYKLLWPGGDLMGLQLYGHPLADFFIECTLAALGWLILRHVRATPSWTRMPAVLWALVLLQGVLNFALRGLKPSACRGSDAHGLASVYERGHVPVAPHLHLPTPHAAPPSFLSRQDAG